MAAPPLLAVDLGGSGLKAGLFDPEGACLAVARRPIAFDEDATGRSEQDPRAWVRALEDATRELGEAAEGGVAGAAGITITGYTRTQVCIDADGVPVRPALSFRDHRAEEDAERLRRVAEETDHPEMPRLNAHHPLARLAWLARTAPEAWARTATVLEPKDYLVHHLTGIAAADAISMARLDAARALAPRMGLTPLPMPPIRPVGAIIGLVRGGLEGALAPLEGAVVAITSHDAWTAALGLGGLRPGVAYGVCGTTDVTGLLVSDMAAAPGLLTVKWGRKLWHLGGPSQNGAGALGWLFDLIGVAPGPMAVRLEAALADQSGLPLLFHPYLRGERVPHWDDRLRAGFFGLDVAHRPGDLARAVLEGLALASAETLEQAEAATGVHAEAVRLAGGAAQSAWVRRVRADVLQREVLAWPGDEAGLRGCVAVARAALGLDADPFAAAERILPPPVRVTPDPAVRERSFRLRRAFTSSLPALRSTAHALSELPTLRLA